MVFWFFLNIYNLNRLKQTHLIYNPSQSAKLIPRLSLVTITPTVEREGNIVHGNFFPQPNTALRESKIPQSTVRMQQPVTAPYPLSSRYNNNTSTFFGSLSATFTLAFGLALPPRTLLIVTYFLIPTYCPLLFTLFANIPFTALICPVILSQNSKKSKGKKNNYF